MLKELLFYRYYVFCCISEDGVCACRGDPHCFQFDAEKNNLSDEIYVTGSCTYTLARDDCTGDGREPEFKVNANFERVEEGSPRSYVKEVFINYYGSPPHVSYLWYYELIELSLYIVVFLIPDYVDYVHYVDVCVIIIITFFVLIGKLNAGKLNQCGNYFLPDLFVVWTMMVVPNHDSAFLMALYVYSNYVICSEHAGSNAQ